VAEVVEYLNKTQYIVFNNIHLLIFSYLKMGKGIGTGDGVGRGSGHYKGKSDRIAVPAMPLPMALICCVLNFLIPGLGKHYFSSVTYEV
jgi:uncharacterized membrane-anchored protein YitT (DUF2179 family)